MWKKAICFYRLNVEMRHGVICDCFSCALKYTGNLNFTLRKSLFASNMPLLKKSEASCFSRECGLAGGGLVGKLKSVVSSSFFLLFIVSSFAEAKDSFSEADELLLFQDMDLVVSASRLKQPENLLSVPVTVLSADDLHYGGHTSIAEALRYAPGVDVIRMDRNRYGIGIHGLEGMFSDRMMTLVDGMPADSPAFGGPEFTSLPLMMEDIERIEIVRGSGGAAWGANALSGVIHIITKEPGEEQGLFVTSTVSVFGDSSSQVRYSDSSGNWRWLLSAGYEDKKSSADALDDEDGADDFQRRALARTAFIYETESELKISFGAGGTGTESGIFETANTLAADNNDLDTGNGYLRAEKIFSSSSEGYLRWAGRYQDMDRPSYGEARYKVREHDIEGQMTLTGLEKHAIALGGNARSTHLSSRPAAYNVFTLADEDVYERWFGLFVSDRYQHTTQLGLEAQFRVDYFTEGSTDWSGRVSSIYGIDVNMDHVLRFSGAKSYRQPVGFIRNAIFHSTPSTAPLFHFYVDPDMDSEQAWSVEAGYSWKMPEDLTLKVDLYYMWYSDLIGGSNLYGMAEEGVPEIFMVVTNTGDADGFGGELQLDYASGPWLWTAWYAYSDFETEYENQSIRAFLPAENKIGLKLRWKITGSWTANGQYAYSDAIKEDISDDTVSSSNRLDITLAKSFLERKGEIMFGVIDLLEKEYDPLVGLDQTAGNKIPGRTFFARLQYTF